MNDLSTIDSGQVAMAVTTEELLNRVKRIQEVQSKVMKKGVDYGLVPGCGDKPTLLKPGAETLLLAFQMAAVPDQLSLQDLGNDDEVRYRVVTPIVHIPTGRVCGHGVGECSSLEEKFKWRKAICQEEFDETDPDRRRVKYAKGREGVYKVQQVRTNKADVANTVLKMGKKRSLVDGALTTVAASRIFTQDKEDLPEELRDVAGVDEQGHPAEQVPLSGVLSPNFGQYPKTDLARIPVESLREYLEGVLQSIENPKKASFKSRNETMRDHIKTELAKREQPQGDGLKPDAGSSSTPAGYDSQQVKDAPAAISYSEKFALCQSVSEWAKIQNAIEKDPALDVFQRTRLHEEGEARLKELKADKSKK